MSLIVIQDPADREREEAQRRRYEEIMRLVEQKQAKEPHIVMCTICPTCGQKRHVPVGEKKG